MPETESFSSQAWSQELNKAIHDYHLFASQVTSLEAKEFMAYHNACKAALAHILILKKLIHSAVQSENSPNFLALLTEAQKATEGQEDDDDSFD